jgi:hypothetical protein
MQEVWRAEFDTFREDGRPDRFRQGGRFIVEVFQTRNVYRPWRAKIRGTGVELAVRAETPQIAKLRAERFFVERLTQWSKEEK